MPEIEPAIEVEDLAKIYPRGMAVAGISFALPAGSITGLLGGNGAGKTTTIAMIMGLVTPTSGTVKVLGADMTRQRYRVLHRMNFESPYVEMPMRLTVRQNLTVFGHLYGVPDLAGRNRHAGSVSGCDDAVHSKIAGQHEGDPSAVFPVFALQSSTEISDTGVPSGRIR